MDEIDFIQIRDKIFDELALQQRKKNLVSSNGRCLWCYDAPVSGASQAFCSQECGEDYEKATRNYSGRG